MKVSEIDKNIVVEHNLELSDVVWFKSKEAPFKIYGVSSDEHHECFYRMPPETAKAVRSDVYGHNDHTTGGRIRFRTNSRYVALKADMPHHGTMQHMPLTGSAGFDLYKNDGGEYFYDRSFAPGENAVSYCNTDGEWHTYTIYMPIFVAVREVYIGLAADAEIEPAEDYTYPKPILYYGSSITHGGCASRPSNIYPAMISRRFDCDYFNLGYSGSAKGEDAMIEYLATVKSAVFVCDYDHNTPNAAHLEATHEKLVRAYRAANPDTPIIMVSRPDYEPERQPYDIWKTDPVRCRMIVRSTYEKLVAEGDTLVGYVDGALIFDHEFRDSCTVDGVHPNDLDFACMAKKIGDEIAKFLK